MDELERRVYSQAGIEKWEEEMIERVVAKAHSSERMALRAELVRKVFTVKNEPRPGIRNWKRYLARILRNERVNWVRKWMAKEKRQVEILESKTNSESGRRPGVILSAVKRDLDRAIAVAEACKELTAEQWLLLKTLDEAEGNQTLAAKRLGIHRNTLRKRLREIQEILIRHGL